MAEFISLLQLTLQFCHVHILVICQAKSKSVEMIFSIYYALVPKIFRQFCDNIFIFLYPQFYKSYLNIISLHRHVEKLVVLIFKLKCNFIVSLDIKKIIRCKIGTRLLKLMLSCF